MNPQVSLNEIARLFLKLGVIGFGGPAAHIAMMQHEVVVKKKWLTEQHFLDLVGATNLIPGPNSTEMAIHIGHEKAGWKGLLVAGCCFILPAVLITGVIGFAYHQYGTLPQVSRFLDGIKPAIIAVILAAVFPLAKRAIKTKTLGLLGVLVVVGSFFPIHEIALLLLAGLAGIFTKYLKNSSGKAFSVFPVFILKGLSAGTGAVGSSISSASLFWIFLKIGAILYGSGYVLFAFLDTELVQTGFMSREILIDAIAVGQITPGPVFSSVTFIGYQLDGVKGAVISTVAIFIPSFLFVAFLNPLVHRMRNSQHFSAFLDAVNVASIALIVVVSFVMARESIVDWRTLLIGLISGVICFGFKRVNSALVILFGAVAGFLLGYI
jgi:chromate transporter